jgi:hypothetical protein
MLGGGSDNRGKRKQYDVDCDAHSRDCRLAHLLRRYRHPELDPTGDRLRHARARQGLYGLIFRGAPAVGALSAGTTSAYFGLRPPILLGALFVLSAGL